jgi:signal transduction histidine kinase
VTITASVTDGHANLAVTDQGPGFPPEFPPIAFDRFTRADAARTRHPDDREPAPRSGLGLAIVAAVIAAHHGTATAGGAQVTIRWPLPDTGSPSPESCFVKSGVFAATKGQVRFLGSAMESEGHVCLESWPW